MSNKVQIANILLTRRCNLCCDHCMIVKDIPNVPQYPTMEYYQEHELDSSEWIDIISRLKQNNPNIFLIFRGGEPFLYNGFFEILNFCHDNNILYRVASNNSIDIQSKIIEVYKAVGSFKGFISSVDPIVPTKNYEIKKTNISKLERLVSIKNDGISDVVVAEIAVDKLNIQYLYNTVKQLSLRNIYSLIAPIDQQKSKFYDFSSIHDCDKMLPKDDVTKSVFEQIKYDKHLLIHRPDGIEVMYNDLPCDMFCSIHENIHNITIDVDSSIRLCLRVRGLKTSTKKFIDYFDTNGNIDEVLISNMASDYRNNCRGCMWTCMYDSNYH